MENTNQLRSKTFPQLFRVGVLQLLISRNYHIIVVISQDAGQLTKVFANLPLRSVALNRGASGFQGDSQTEMIQIIFDPEDGAFRKLDDLRLIQEASVLPRIMQAEFVTERPGGFGTLGRTLQRF